MQYVPFASDIEIPFYAALASHKINHDKLDDSARKLLGLYEIRSSDAPENSSRMQIHGNALTSDEYVSPFPDVERGIQGLTCDRRVPAGYYRAEGMIKNVNTIEEYRSIDKGNMLQQAGRTVRFPNLSKVALSNIARFGTL
jgi:ubiquitin-like modifier-activating enzyme ATG7